MKQNISATERRGCHVVPEVPLSYLGPKINYSGWDSSVPPGKGQISASNYATTTALHIHANTRFTNHSAIHATY
jgi:hypothetical protein